MFTKTGVNVKTGIIDPTFYRDDQNRVGTRLIEATDIPTSIEKKENSIVVLTDDEMKAGQVNDMLVTHFVRRKVDPLCLKKKELEKAGGNKIKQIYDLIEGIDQSICKKLIADVKSSKIKVQVKINGNELRVDGKKKDDLQSVIQLIESSNIGIPIQFINFRD